MILIDENIKKLITQKAEELGFVKTGFAKAEILDKEAMKLKEWMNKDYDADMTWIKKGFEKRKDVKLIMENAKTVISLAYNYFTPFTHYDRLPKISRYAWGKDYHKILKKKLKNLCAFIENNLIIELLDLPDRIQTIYYVDDGPVMDKVWAQKAGIGWQGKHTNIINPEYGSWLFLCEIITNLDCSILDKPIEDLCGNCRICMDACPTGAIVEGYNLNSTLCISYQTIENKEDIPEFINLNGWIFGCDICQDVCPFNRNNYPSNDVSFQPKPVVFNKSKAELDKLTEEQFNDFFKDSPIKRTKYKGWKRNLNLYSQESSKT